MKETKHKRQLLLQSSSLHVSFIAWEVQLPPLKSSVNTNMFRNPSRCIYRHILCPWMCLLSGMYKWCIELPWDLMWRSNVIKLQSSANLNRTERETKRPSSFRIGFKLSNSFYGILNRFRASVGNLHERNASYLCFIKQFFTATKMLNEILIHIAIWQNSFFKLEPNIKKNLDMYFLQQFFGIALRNENRFKFQTECRSRQLRL